MKGNPHKKAVWQDNFIKRWCKSSKNHPEGWAWWKRWNRKMFRARDKREVKNEQENVCDY